jgi:hypothetical protein
VDIWWLPDARARGAVVTVLYCLVDRRCRETHFDGLPREQTLPPGGHGVRDRERLVALLARLGPGASPVLVARAREALR